MITETQLANKRTRRVLRRRTLKNGRRRNAASYEVGRYRLKMRIDAEALEKQRQALEEQREQSRAAVREATAGKRSGFLDRVKSGLRRMLPRRSGGAD